MPISIPLKKQRKKISFYRKNRILNANAIVLVNTSDKTVEKILVEGLLDLEINIVLLAPKNIFKQYSNNSSLIKIENMEDFEDKIILDIFVTDTKGDSSYLIPDLMKLGVIPVIPEKNLYNGVLVQFNPMEFVGNAFMYKKISGYQLLSGVIRVLENIQYPADKKILLKNILNTF